MTKDFLPFEIPDENTIERAKRIMNSNLDELLAEEKKFRLDYE